MKALQCVFLHSFNELVKDQLASSDEPTSFEGLVSLALANCLRERLRTTNSINHQVQ